VPIAEKQKEITPEIQKLIEDLKQESEMTTTLVIVEGNNDIQALQSVGIEQNIIAFKRTYSHRNLR
jgi:5S rRNA maturation endonuclease (ribonuclease M5)